MKNVFNILVSITLLGFVFLYSCKKDVEPTTAEIRVVSAEGNPIPFANILLTCTSSVNLPCEIEIFAQADENGIYRKDFDLPKVLSVIAGGNLYDTIITGVLPDTTMTFIKDTICGETFISIKPEQVSVQTIILYDCN